MEILDGQQKGDLTQVLSFPIGRIPIELACERSCDLDRDVVL